MDELTRVCEIAVVSCIRKRISIASAESITGGMFAKCVTDIPGASNVFSRSIVTYTFEAKNQELGVDIDFLNKEGAVNEKTAHDMVQGLYDKCHADICISVTGVAGPGPDSYGNPAGQFFIGLANKGEISVYEFNEGSIGRNNVREMACRSMFELVCDIVD